MVKTNCECGCSGMKRFASKANLRAGDIRIERVDGRAYTVLPVVMARAGVVMNGQLIEEAELFPDAWNGRPVTMGHPLVDGVNVSANQPDILSEFAVGVLFNSRVENGALKAEAWVDNKLADKIAPGFLALVKNGAQIDVSTGYWSDDVPAQGVSDGRAYQTIGKHLKPDHLAFLPDEEGACNWTDGCGIRANKELPVMSTIHTLITNALKAAERGDDDDTRTIIADLIANDDSPFTPDDSDSLLMMSAKTLKRMRDKFLAKRKPRAQEEQTTEEAFEYAQPAARTNAQRERDRREFEAFAPMSTVVANAIRKGKDPAPIRERLADRATRARNAYTAAARAARPAGGVALNAHERETVAIPSTLEAFRARKGR